MAKQDLKNLSTHELQKKKTIATVLLWILFGVGLLSIGIGAVRGRHELFATPAVLFAVGYPMYAGMKKVEAELRRRDGERAKGGLAFGGIIGGTAASIAAIRGPKSTEILVYDAVDNNGSLLR